MKLLSDDDIRVRLAALPGWTRDGNAIRRSYNFGSFASAMAFVNRVAELAETADHHPDIDIRYNRVEIVLSTHSAGGLTTRDTNLAIGIEETAGPAS
jgi:4a-hydroxytetrahydrobiopterin dehydratase